ncbi:hypothetical protein BASA81_006807 [Batrachochytrium salamandrivorans]|nr:hypothetical protein BASA81_006807 [Batrachochytrium salamandrivorans]
MSLPKHATVAGFRFGDEDEDSGGFVEYQVCLDGFPCAWRRYSEFDALRLQLIAKPAQAPFPPKRLFRTKHVHEERKLGLELWLNSLLEQIDPLREFGLALALRAFFNSEPWYAAAAPSRRKLPVATAEEETAPPAPPSPQAPAMLEVDWDLLATRLDSEFANFRFQQQDAKEEFDLAAFQAKLREAEALYKL